MITGKRVLELKAEVCSLNVAGLTKEKVLHFRKSFKNSSIVCLQETHGEEKNIKSRIASLGFDDGVFSLYNKAARGSAVLWKKPFERIGNEWIDNQGRIAGVVLRQGEKGPKVMVLSVYAPNVSTVKTTQADYISCLISLDHGIRELTKEKPDMKMMLGDFNIICDAELDSRSAEPKIYPVPLEGLQEILDNYKLFDGFRTMFPERVDYIK